MDACYHLLLVFLLVGFCSSENSPVSIFVDGPAPGKPQNVSKNDTEVKEAVLTATYTFNNMSNDAFFFKASAIVNAQRKVVKGIMYILKVKLSRTVCMKRETTDLADCAFQLNPKLQQTFLCNFEVWAILWQKMMRTISIVCLPSTKHC